MVSVKNAEKCVLIGLILGFTYLPSCRGSDYDYDEPKTTLSGCPWIRNKLKNGRIKIRARGRIAKFFCNSRFEMVGKRFATCVHGEWNNPVPLCVTKGCPKMQEPRNGKLVDDLYQGGFLLYSCNPGYILSGPPNLHCDGKQWNSHPPTCEISVAQPQFSCDFEDPDLCGWSEDPSHDFYWLRNQFGTPSGHVGTGPSYDHTFGKSKGGFYLYIEASAPRKENDTCRIFSPVYQSTNSPGCFVFWYHMYGATTGGLRVYLKPESQVFGELLPSWSKFGDQGNHWLRGNVSIPHFDENFQIIIEGIRGSSYVGDSAIDDVSLLQMDCAMLDSMNMTETTTEASTDSCRGRCQEWDSLFSCGCTDDCWTNNTCCSDYTKICTARNITADDASELSQDNGQTEVLIPALNRTTNFDSESTIDITQLQTEMVESSTALPSTTSSRLTTVSVQSKTVHLLTGLSVDTSSQPFIVPKTTESSSTVLPTTLSNVSIFISKLTVAKPIMTSSLPPSDTELPIKITTPQMFTAKILPTTPPILTTISATTRLLIVTVPAVNTKLLTATASSAYTKLSSTLSTRTMSDMPPFMKTSLKPSTRKAMITSKFPIPTRMYDTTRRFSPLSSTDLTTKAFTPTKLFTETILRSTIVTSSGITSTKSQSTTAVLPTSPEKTDLSQTKIFTTVKKVPDIKISQMTSAISTIFSNSSLPSLETTSPMTSEGTPMFWNTQEIISVSPSASYDQTLPITDKTQNYASSTPSTKKTLTPETSTTTILTADTQVTTQVTSKFTLGTLTYKSTRSSNSNSSSNNNFNTAILRHITLSNSVTRGEELTTKVVTRTKVEGMTTEYDTPQVKYSDNSPSKSATKSSSSTSISGIIGMIFGIILLAAVVVGITYAFMKKKKQTKGKLPEDSEMRFLSDNEVLEYSDPTSLDKMLLS